MILSVLIASMMGCSTQAQQPCDSSVYICDTAAYWGRINDDKATIDTTDGTWIDQAYLPGCDGDPDRWKYSAKTGGLTFGNNIVNAWAPEDLGGWNEEHPLLSVNASITGVWDALLTEVRDEATIAQYEPGARTAYTCGEHDVEVGMVYAYRVYDLNGSYAGCAIFGTGPDAAANVAKVFAVDYPEDNPVTDRAEINLESCQMWVAGPDDATQTGSTRSR
ncbi:MAG: hypothetical protein GWP91_13455 [Rhodobacterales bacterium]|nr:hypothetical protein [Rhodobacterales bacterium]